MRITLTEKFVTVIHVTINIALIAIYVMFFGKTSLKKFLNKAVVTSTKEESPSSIPPPG